MALNFPNSPANGQIYVANNVIYTWNGYVWESSTAPGSKGQKGEIGDKGDLGPAGSKGDKGDQGVAGAKGDKGQDGAAAAKGDKGDKGFVGTQGVKGDKGERVTVWKGSSPPTDTNLLWFNTVDGNFLVYYDDGDTPYWVDASPTVVGDKGDKGDKGQKGDTILNLDLATANTFEANNATIDNASISTANIGTLNATTLNLPSLSVRVFDDISPMFDDSMTVFPLTVNGNTIPLTASEQLLVTVGGVVVEPNYDTAENTNYVFSLQYIINNFTKGYRINTANNSIEFASPPLSGQSFAARTLSQTQSFASIVAPPNYINPIAIALD